MFKIGDKVFSKHFGIGKVVEIQDFSSWPVKVAFPGYSPNPLSFTQEGVFTPEMILNPEYDITHYFGAELEAVTNDEVDPDGIDAHSPGAKLDAGKPRVALVLGGFANALLEVSKVGTYGAKKYTDNGWKEVKNGDARYADAAGRHRLYREGGQDYDPDTKLLHLAHECWNVLAELELVLEELNAPKCREEAGPAIEDGSGSTGASSTGSES